jgi:hypothetical protein
LVILNDWRKLQMWNRASMTRAAYPISELYDLNTEQGSTSTSTRQRESSEKEGHGYQWDSSACSSILGRRRHRLDHLDNRNSIPLIF